MKRVSWRLLPVILPAVGLIVLCGGCDRAGSEHVASEDPHDHAADGGEHADGHDEGHTDEVTLSDEAIGRWGVTITTAERRVLTPTLTAPARVSLNEERVAHVGSVVSGRVGELFVRVGEVVKAGDPLLGIDSPELGRSQSEYLQRLTDVESAEASLGVARGLYERGKALHERTQAIALTEVQRREADYQSALGTLRAATGAAAAAKNELRLLGMDDPAIESLERSGEVNPRYTVRGPIDGTVVEREVTLGEAVGPDREALGVIADLSTVWVIADVPEVEIGEVGIGAPVTIRAGAGERPLRGRVTYIAARLNTQTRSVPVRIEVEDAEGKIRPGMFVEAAIRRGSANGEPVLAVPEEAVQTVEGGPVVFVPVEGEPNTFTIRPITTGGAVDGWLAVRAGLEEGERYVSGGSFILKADLGKAGAEHQH